MTRDIIQTAALLTHAYVTSHKPISVDATVDILEQFIEQLRGVEISASLPLMPSNKSGH